jgi:membrane-associated progesterone receptor component
MTLLSNPLNVCLIPPILYVLYLIIFPTPTRPTTTPHLYSEEHYNWIPDKHPDVACYRKYTAKELQPYNGLNGKEKDGGRILLAIMRTGVKGEKLERTVFDVTAGRTFYGPGASIAADGCEGNADQARRDVWQFCRT